MYPEGVEWYLRALHLFLVVFRFRFFFPVCGARGSENKQYSISPGQPLLEKPWAFPKGNNGGLCYSIFKRAGWGLGAGSKNIPYPIFCAQFFPSSSKKKNFQKQFIIWYTTQHKRDQTPWTGPTYRFRRWTCA